MQLRDQIKASVMARVPVDERERISLQTFDEQFDLLADPCSEHANAVHVTGSAIVIGPRGVLLHRHKSLGIWIQPGGHIEPGEAPWDGALRETVEETGLGAHHPDNGPVLVHVDVHPGPRGHTHLDLRYLLIGPDADPAPPPGESQEVQWFSWDAAIDICDDGLTGALVAIRATLGDGG